MGPFEAVQKPIKAILKRPYNMLLARERSESIPSEVVDFGGHLLLTGTGVAYEQNKQRRQTLAGYVGGAVGRAIDMDKAGSVVVKPLVVDNHHPAPEESPAARAADALAAHIDDHFSQLTVAREPVALLEPTPTGVARPYNGLVEPIEHMPAPEEIPEEQQVIIATVTPAMAEYSFGNALPLNLRDGAVVKFKGVSPQGVGLWTPN